MDKNTHLGKAKDFSGERDAYIHCEIKNGETQLVVGGQTFGIVYGVYRTLKRTSEITGLPVEEMIKLIEELLSAERDKNYPFDKEV